MQRRVVVDEAAVREARAAGMEAERDVELLGHGVELVVLVAVGIALTDRARAR